jgi:hypothetical protein
MVDRQPETLAQEHCQWRPDLVSHAPETPDADADESAQIGLPGRRAAAVLRPDFRQ